MCVICPQETPSWPCRSSKGTSYCPQQSRGSRQTPGRNPSSPSSCPHPSHKFSANEPPEAPGTPHTYTYKHTTHPWGALIFIKQPPISIRSCMKCWCGCSLMMSEELQFQLCPRTETSWLFISIWLRNLCVVWTMKINFIYCMSCVITYIFARQVEETTEDAVRVDVIRTFWQMILKQVSTDCLSSDKPQLCLYHELAADHL